MHKDTRVAIKKPGVKEVKERPKVNKDFFEVNKKKVKK